MRSLCCSTASGYNKAEAQDIRRRNKVHIDRLKKYDDISGRIKVVNSELKKLKNEQANTGMLHVIKHYKLHSRVSEQKEKLEELKTERNLIANKMNCRDSEDIREFRKRLNAELKAADDMLRLNRDLTARKDELTAKFKETAKEIEPNMLPEINKERGRLRTEIYIPRLRRELGRMYDRYDPDILEEAKSDTDKELGESSTPAANPEPQKERRSVREELERNKARVKEHEQQRRRGDIQAER